VTEVGDVPGCTTIGIDLWFPGKGRYDYIKLAKMVCSSCPIQPACLEGALGRREPWGVWGGMTAGERRTELLRRLASEAA